VLPSDRCVDLDPRVEASLPSPIAVGHSYGGAVSRNAAAQVNNVVGLVYVAAFATEGEVLGEAEAGSKDSVLMGALVPHRYPSSMGGEPAVEFAIDPAKFRHAFAADLPAGQTAVMAVTQRPAAELAFSEPGGKPAWKHLPSWAVVATATRRRVPISSGRWRSVPARRSPRSRALTSS
jgi:pimeloyl-ACP methyl ester carboxylesterase